MIKRDELSNLTSCLNKAALDEPIFVLRAHDPSAPATVRHWASLYHSDKSSRRANACLTPDQYKKYLEALTIAASMEQWLKAQQRLPGPPVKWYSACGEYWNHVVYDVYSNACPVPRTAETRCVRCGWLSSEHAR